MQNKFFFLSIVTVLFSVTACNKAEKVLTREELQAQFSATYEKVQICSNHRVFGTKIDYTEQQCDEFSAQLKKLNEEWEKLNGVKK